MIFAVGSDRCGTKTMAQVLGIPHESVLLSWGFSRTQYDQSLATAIQMGSCPRSISRSR